MSEFYQMGNRATVYLENNEVLDFRDFVSSSEDRNFKENFKDFLEENDKEECEWDELDVSKVTDMHDMFRHAFSFNQPIGDWDVSKVTTMQGMFVIAKQFNQPIRHWDVSKVTNMAQMFHFAESFNQPIGNWNV